MNEVMQTLSGLLGGLAIFLFGDIIGTTITVLLACIGQSKNAQRTALRMGKPSLCLFL